MSEHILPKLGQLLCRFGFHKRPFIHMSEYGRRCPRCAYWWHEIGSSVKTDSEHTQPCDCVWCRFKAEAADRHKPGSA